MIKVHRKMVEVRPAFREEIVSIARKKLLFFKEEIEYCDPAVRGQIKKNRAVPISKLAKIVKGDHDEMITKLRTLNYQYIDIHEFRGTRYVAARTNNIVLDEKVSLFRHGAKGIYALGEYAVFLPIRNFLEGTYEDMHLVPMDFPNTRARHPHHTAYLTNIFEVSGNPLDMSPSTCIGSVGTPMLSALQDGDFVETLRYITVFLRRYNESSPLVALGSCPHARLYREN